MLDGPEKSLGDLLDEAQRAWRRALHEALARRNAPQLGAAAYVLAQLNRSGISQSLLAERLGLSKQAVQQSLDQLERQGLVRRDLDPVDRRAKYVVLTKAGLYALEAHRDAEEEVERRFQEALGTKRFARLRKALRRVADSMPDKT